MSDQLGRLALSEEGFVFDPRTGDSFQVSETGIVVLREFKEGRGDEETAQRLTELFDVTLQEAQQDCADFRARLQHFGLA